MSAKLNLPNGWNEKRLKDVGKCLTGLTYSPNDVTDDSGLLVLRSSNVQGGKLVFNDNVFVKRNIKVTNYAQNGDILVCVRNGSRNLIGKNALITPEGEGLAHGAFMMLFRSDYSQYLYQLFSSDMYNKQVYRNLGATINSINSSDFYDFKFPFPPLPEQKAIAELLSTWDEVIEKTERLIQVKEKLKLAELHSLISRQEANSTIGSFAKPVVRIMDKPDEPYMALGIRSHFKGTFQRFVEDPSTVNMDSLYMVKENDLIVNITFAWEGAIALVKKEDEQCYVSHRFPTYEIKRTKAAPCFIRQLIMSSRMKYDLSNISPGGAGRNRVLNKKDFLKMPIWLPDIGTQQNIGEYLGEIDTEIELLKHLAEKYRRQKRGLMQKLLIGEWRVNAGKEAA